MPKTQQTPQLQQVLELSATLSIEEQAALVEIIGQRLKQDERATLVQEVRIAEREYEQGQAHRGSVADLMTELDR
ncbi:MAG: hypothetical protein ACPGVO_10760 [Spirulinaceae cyanobacterium]